MQAGPVSCRHRCHQNWLWDRVNAETDDEAPACDAPCPAHAWQARMTGGRQEGDGKETGPVRVSKSPRGSRTLLRGSRGKCYHHHHQVRGPITPGDEVEHPCGRQLPSRAENCPAWAGCFGGQQAPHPSSTPG